MDLQAMSTGDLLALFNKTTGQSVKRFADRKTALKRVQEALANPVKSKSVVKRLEVQKAGRAGTGTRRRGFNFPLIKGGAKEIRPETNRATLVGMLRKGASFEACVEKAGFKDERNTYQAIRLLHTYCGFGLTQGDNGVIHLVE
jgi:hypothetical protein